MGNINIENKIYCNAETPTLQIFNAERKDKNKIKKEINAFTKTNNLLNLVFDFEEIYKNLTITEDDLIFIGNKNISIINKVKNNNFIIMRIWQKARNLSEILSNSKIFLVLHDIGLNDELAKIAQDWHNDDLASGYNINLIAAFYK